MMSMKQWELLWRSGNKSESSVKCDDIPYYNEKIMK